MAQPLAIVPRELPSRKTGRPLLEGPPRTIDAAREQLQIVFGKRSGDTLPAQVHFCVPSKQSEIGGGFMIPLK